jgi:hypothetical protein
MTAGQDGVRELSGFLSSGERFIPVCTADAAAYKKFFGEEMKCEKGCKVFKGSRG